MRRTSYLCILVFTLFPAIGWGQFGYGYPPYGGHPQPVQQRHHVGIDGRIASFFYAEQRSQNWCWAASIQNVLNYYGVWISQEQIVARTFGTDLYGRLPDQPGQLHHITANLNNISMDNRGRVYQVAASHIRGFPSDMELLRTLSQGVPLIVGHMTGGPVSHAVVVTAASYIETPYGPVVQTVVVRDPFPYSPEHQARGGRREYDAALFRRNVFATWAVYVQ